MRIHTRLTSPALHAVLAIEKADGRIFDAVYLDVTEHGSRSHARAFEVRLISYEYDGVGRRRPAGYSRNYDDTTWAATYDEWGWFLSRLFEVDPDARCGSAKHPDYADAEHFDLRTGWTYAPLSQLHLDYDSTLYVYDEAPFVSRYAIRKDGRPKAGRTGYGRVSEEGGENYDYVERGLRSGWLVESHRDVTDVLSFARIENHDAVLALTGGRMAMISPTGRTRRLPASTLGDTYALGQIVEMMGYHVRTTDDRVLAADGELPMRMVRTLDRNGRPSPHRYDDEGRLTDLGGVPLGPMHAANADAPATYEEARKLRAEWNAETRRWEAVGS